jgi:hypothetical protein
LRILDIDNATLTNVHANDGTTRNASKPLKSASYHVRPIIIESHAVDQSTVSNKAKETRTRITRLRDGGHRAHFDVTESERSEANRHVRVLVEAGCETERRRKTQSEGLDPSFVRGATDCSHY